jgi:hypothetical protein
MMSLQEIARAMGGVVSAGGVNAPGPGHKPSDRSLRIFLDNGPDVVRVHSFANDDPTACKDYVRQKLGLPAWQPSRPGSNGNSHAKPNGNGAHYAAPAAHPIKIETPSQDCAACANLPSRTPPNEEGKPKFFPWGDDGPPRHSNEIRRHVYLRDDSPVRIKVKSEPGDNRPAFVNWYRVSNDGEPGWQAKKPDGYASVPYLGAIDPFDPELAGDAVHWPEGEKDCDTLGKINLPAFTFGGVGDGLPENAAPFLAGRHVVILADNDAPGRKHAEDKAALATSAGATSVRVVHFPELQSGGDVSDFLVAGGTEAALMQRVEAALPWTPTVEPADQSASAASDDSPIPLIPELAPAALYPVGALGAVLGEAAVSIARKVQCPVEIAAQSVLAVASLAAQAHADVLMPFGQTRPLSLFLFSIALSSDRKTSADYEALTPIRERERALGDQYGYDLEQARMCQAAWQGERKKIEADKKLDYEKRTERLKRLGREPDLPLHPILTAPEPTVEGLVKMWPNAPAALGLFSAEGGQLVGGHSMSEDNRLKTAAAYSELWDGKPVRRVRAGDGVTILNGRRFALHVMIQPEAAQAFLSDSLLRSQGLLSRILIASPPTMAGQRFYKAADEHDSSSIRAYSRVVGGLLEMPWPLADGKRNELLPRVLPFSSDAVGVWREFYDHIESRSGPGSELAAVREFAGKAAEHAARIAGVLAVVADAGAQEIGANTMRDAAALVEWYVGESQRLAAAAMTDPRIARAQRLLEWTRASGVNADGVSVRDGGISVRWITRFAPTDLRTKDTAESAVAVLVNHGWFRDAGKPKRWSLVEGARS